MYTSSFAGLSPTSLYWVRVPYLLVQLSAEIKQAGVHANTAVVLVSIEIAVLTISKLGTQRVPSRSKPD